MSIKKLIHEDYTVEIGEPSLYVDNKQRKRSGHMTHGLAALNDTTFIDFNSNCSATRWDGHSPYGWIEYRLSRDSGKTYSPIQTLPYSVDCFLDGMHTISVEKAVATDNGTIVAFCLRNDATQMICCNPWDTSFVVRSFDEGKTWEDAFEMCNHKGRIYDALYYKGNIYVMLFCNENFLGETKEHVFRIYKSCDDGKTFEELSIVPFDTLGRGYGAMIFDENGVFHAYTYNQNDEIHMDHAKSYDLGKTWQLCEPCFVEKGIRNPQTALIDGVYILHGRSGDWNGFVLYSSIDAENWDEGIFIKEDKFAAAFYSNNVNLKDEIGNFLLIQYSDKYDGCRVNVNHLNVRIIKN